jgi:hypothetical protein
VSGFAVLQGLPAEGAEVEAVYLSGPNYASGTVVNTGRAQSDGAFKVWALLPGEYRIELTLRHPVTGFVSTATVNGVVVAAGSETQLGAVSLN